jgi:hypothetical protein
VVLDSLSHVLYCSTGILPGYKWSGPVLPKERIRYDVGVSQIGRESKKFASGS